jgi:hypothetical protein
MQSVRLARESVSEPLSAGVVVGLNAVEKAVTAQPVMTSLIDDHQPKDECGCANQDDPPAESIRRWTSWLFDWWNLRTAGTGPLSFPRFEAAHEGTSVQCHK